MMHPDLDVSSSRYIVPGDPEWPSQLDVLGEADQPAGLWVMGDGRLNELAAKAVAVTGSRASSAYGDVVAAEMADQLASAGYTIVNSGAYGIDAAALRGAISGAAPTIAVLAGGMDCLYPAGHYGLFQNVIACGGLLVTEHALGEHPSRAAFLRRNRLIAALTEGTVMVEAAVRSGARNVITWANELGRETMAVPGPVTSATSLLPHQLIRDGKAAMVTSGADVIAQLSAE